MKSRMDLLRTQGTYVWDKEGWFVSLSDALEGVGAAEAAWQPQQGGNTIWQTINHINYYNQRILNELSGHSNHEKANNDETFGEPGDPDDSAGWQETVENTYQIIQNIQQAFEQMNDNDLDEHPIGEALPRWIMHDAHHTGQIVLIRKQQGSWPEQREM